MTSALSVSRLQSGQAEQIWIEQQLAAGLKAPAMAVINYRRPCLIYGRRGGDNAAANGRAALLYYATTQRRSGGGAVLAGPWMLGLNLLLPADHPCAALSHVQAFNWFGRVWQQALADLGIACHLANAEQFQQHQSLVQQHRLDWVCFAGISHGELLDTEGRKVLGLAQYRGRWGTLLSAGLLTATTPWEELEFIHTGQRPECSALHTLTAPLPQLDTPVARQALLACLLNHLHTPSITTTGESLCKAFAISAATRRPAPDCCAP